MIEVTERVYYPFACPSCGLEAKVYGRGSTWHLLPERSCTHAISTECDATGRVLVVFARDEEE